MHRAIETLFSVRFYMYEPLPLRSRENAIRAVTVGALSRMQAWGSAEAQLNSLGDTSGLAGTCGCEPTEVLSLPASLTAGKGVQ